MRILSTALLLAVTGCASNIPANMAGPAAIGAVDWAKATTVEVHLGDFHFHPETLRFNAGAPVALVLINTGGTEHKFVAPRFFAEAVIKPGQARPGVDGITLKAGERTRIDLAPTRPDTYGLECTEMLHSMLGMSGSIVVVP
ncbi:plastocyanin/azurin family copper-binding protein [Roseiterribacter gracilis]|uniref:Blue (type 1) copper domain-containing protein n=1 Tax=Roseiterribacter gracilis TaxID=2812848 RepID=A0A8S8XHX8_9PROT|nr:hypothetical protein TMPK1_31130 [Rhodospirillales bacterium TMPK1]